MCAIEAGRRGRRVVLLDHADRPGKKILISGGGRCNFTNLHTRPENFLSANTHFAKSALARYLPARLHRAGRATRHPLSREDTRAALLRRLLPADRHHAPQGMREPPASGSALSSDPLRPTPRRGLHGSNFRRHRSSPPRWSSPPAASPSRRWAPQASATTSPASSVSTIVETRPALVPLVLAETDQQRWCDLSGLSTEVVASTARWQAPRQLPRETACHPPRPQRPRRAANLLILAPRHQHHRRPRARPETSPRRSARQCSAHPRRCRPAATSGSACTSRRTLAHQPATSELDQHWPRSPRRELHCWELQPQEPRATARLRSLRAVSTQRSSTPAPWKQSVHPASTSSARSSTSRAGWAATTFNGPGPQAPRPGVPFEPITAPSRSASSISSTPCSWPTPSAHKSRMASGQILALGDRPSPESSFPHHTRPTLPRRGRPAG